MLTKRFFASHMILSGSLFIYHYASKMLTLPCPSSSPSSLFIFSLSFFRLKTRNIFWPQLFGIDINKLPPPSPSLKFWCFVPISDLNPLPKFSIFLNDSKFLTSMKQFVVDSQVFHKFAVLMLSQRQCIHAWLLDADLLSFCRLSKKPSMWAQKLQLLWKHRYVSFLISRRNPLLYYVVQSGKLKAILGYSFFIRQNKWAELLMSWIPSISPSKRHLNWWKKSVDR